MGERVRLVPFGEEHLDELAAMFTHPALVEAWPGDNRARFSEMLEEEEGEGFIVMAPDGAADDLAPTRMIGFIQFYEEDDPNYRSASIDVALHPDWCNRGLGTEAVRLLARHLFDERGHHRITIDPRATNGRAIASYRKVGFRDVGVMRRYELGTDGRWHDALLLDLLRDDLR